jgi:opine dehydrogenase
MEKLERVLVMGGGPAGIAAAAALSRRGYHVALFNLPQFQSTIEPLMKVGGVEIEGSLGEEFVPIAVITTDIQEAMRDIQLILIGVPGYGQRPMVETCLPYIKPGNIILLMPGSCGSLEVAQVIKKAGYSLDDVLLGETVTMPQSARMVGEAKIRIRLPSLIRTAAFPGRNTSRLVETIGDTLKLLPKPNVLDPGINNPNILIHPAPMLLNYAAVERAEGLLSIMNEGMTEAVLRLLDAVDAEKMALQGALGLDVVPIDDLYRETGSGPHVYREKGEPFGIRDRIHDRYTKEDVPYGMVLYSSLGDILGVPTPLCDGITTILSAVEQTDYWSVGRTAEKLGITGLDRNGLLHYLETGEQS